MESRGERDRAERIVEEVFRVDEREIDWSIAIAGMLAVALPLLIGLAVGEPTLGLLAALGGLNVAFIVPGREASDRWAWGLLGLVGSVLAITLSDITQPSIAASVIATLLWTSAWSTLRVVGKHGALAGFATGAVFIITNGLPAQPLGPAAAAISVGGVAALVWMLIAGGGPTPKQGEKTWPGIGTDDSRVGSGLPLARSPFRLLDNGDDPRNPSARSARQSDPQHSALHRDADWNYRRGHRRLPDRRPVGSGDYGLANGNGSLRDARTQLPLAGNANHANGAADDKQRLLPRR